MTELAWMPGQWNLILGYDWTELGPVSKYSRAPEWLKDWGGKMEPRGQYHHTIMSTKVSGVTTGGHLPPPYWSSAPPGAPPHMEIVVWKNV